MSESESFQPFLQDLLTLDCDIQTNLHQLLLITTRECLEAKSSEIKRSLKEFKKKLKEMKEFCDAYSSPGRLRSSNSGFYGSSFENSSPKGFYKFIIFSCPFYN